MIRVTTREVINRATPWTVYDPTRLPGIPTLSARNCTANRPSKTWRINHGHYFEPHKRNPGNS